MAIRAQLKKLHSPDTPNLETFRPDGPFGILVQAMVGPFEGRGYESFDILVCTPDWFASNMKEEIALGRHHLFVRAYSYQKLWNFLDEYCASCSGTSWEEVAKKVGRIGMWEFEDYVPYRPPSPGTLTRN